MAGNVNPEAAPRNRYIPRGHALSWWMLVLTTGTILITSIDRVLLPTVLSGFLKGFNLSPTTGGILVGLSFTWHYIFSAAICLLTLVPISLIRETSAGQEEAATVQGV